MDLFEPFLTQALLNYLSKTIETTRQVGPKQATLALKHCIDIKRPVMIWGAPGIGKSETFEQNSFLPHKIYESKVTLDNPILLLTEKYLNNLLIFREYDSIINNLDEPIVQAENHFKVYEFVESSEEKKIISRKKYTIYKNNNFDLNHKKYNG